MGMRPISSEVQDYNEQQMLEQNYKSTKKEEDIGKWSLGGQQSQIILAD